MRLIDADNLVSVLEILCDKTEDIRHWEQLKWVVGDMPTIDPMKWIPVTDRLPDIDGHYLVFAPDYSGGSSTGKENHNSVMFSRFAKGKWSIENGYYRRPGCVKAWMQLPEPWEEVTE